MSQSELIRLHQQFATDAAEADDYRRGHYEHLLVSLNRLIESHGPTPEYQEWTNSTSPTESRPLVALGC